MMEALAPIITLAVETMVEIPISWSENEESATSSEDEVAVLVLMKKKKMSTPQRIENYVEQVIPQYTRREFQQHFRITIEAYEKLLQVVGPSLERTGATGRHTVNVEKQILATIWLLATPDSYRSVGERFDLAKSSLSKCFMRVVKALNGLAPTIVKWPEGQEREDIERRFHAISGLPTVVGAIDGTFIPIKAPKDDPQSYITRKCNYAFTLQAIAVPSLKITDAFIGFPGSVSDSRIFKNSDFYHAATRNPEQFFPDDQYIIGDKAYPIFRWCIPPYINRGNLTPAKVVFNTVHAQTRQVIERAFALLIGRFRRLKFLDMNRNDVIPATVLAACVLHNICLDFRDLHIEEYIEEGRNHLHNVEADYVDMPENLPDAAEGRLRRDQLCQLIYANRNN